MATRFLEMGLPLEGSPYWDKAPFAVDENGVLKVVRGTRYKNALQTADPGAEPIAVDRVVALAVGTTLATASRADHGALFVAGTNVSVTLQLPTAASCTGLTVGLSVGVLTSSGGHLIKPNSADTIVFTSAAAGSSLQCSAASDVLGDVCWLRSAGAANKWYIVNKVGTWAAV